MPPETRRRIHAILADALQLSPLLERLKTAGLSEDQIDVFSARPVSVKLGSGSIDLVIVAFIAGLVGIMLGILLTAGTAALYPIHTGGKPIVAWPVVGLISYETMMLCAIVATVAGLAWRIKAGSRTIRDGPALTGDQVALTIHLSKSGEQSAAVCGILTEAAAVDVRMGEEA